MQYNGHGNGIQSLINAKPIGYIVNGKNNKIIDAEYNINAPVYPVCMIEDAEVIDKAEIGGVCYGSSDAIYYVYISGIIYIKQNVFEILI